jgi:hypothetical protein
MLNPISLNHSLSNRRLNKDDFEVTFLVSIKNNGPDSLKSLYVQNLKFNESNNKKISGNLSVDHTSIINHADHFTAFEDGYYKAHSFTLCPQEESPLLKFNINCKVIVNLEYLEFKPITDKIELFFDYGCENLIKQSHKIEITGATLTEWLKLTVEENSPKKQ